MLMNRDGCLGHGAPRTVWRSRPDWDHRPDWFTVRGQHFSGPDLALTQIFVEVVNDRSLLCCVNFNAATARLRKALFCNRQPDIVVSGCGGLAAAGESIQS